MMHGWLIGSSLSWKMFSLASICHLISQSLSIVRSRIAWSHQVKGAFSFLEISGPKYLNLPKKPQPQIPPQVSVWEKMERSKDLAMGKLESGVCDDPALLHGHIEARFSFSPPTISRYQLQKEKWNCWYIFCMELGDCLHANPTLFESRGQSRTSTWATISALPLSAQANPGPDTTPSSLVLEPPSPGGSLWRHVLQGWDSCSDVRCSGTLHSQSREAGSPDPRVSRSGPSCPPDSNTSPPTAGISRVKIRMYDQSLVYVSKHLHPFYKQLLVVFYLYRPSSLCSVFRLCLWWQSLFRAYSALFSSGRMLMMQAVFAAS